MNGIIDNFETLATAPGGIQRLRELVLQLAVQGKLVPQDPADEPAKELLKRIAKEKARLVKEGKNSKEKPLPAINPEEVPFEVPKGWEWVRLGRYSSRIHYGYTASADHEVRANRLLRITDIQNNSVNWEQVPGCNIDDEQLLQFKLFNGDIVIARTGGTVGKSYLVEGVSNLDAVFASYLIRVSPPPDVNNQFLKRILESPMYWVQLLEKAQGTGQPNVNATSLAELQIPLPPLADQHRIVAKVDELMALLDRLEEAQNTQSATRAALRDSALSALQNGEEISSAWARVEANMGTLFTDPTDVAPLRQTILQLAVQGKLVPQNPSDEPAKELLKRIAKEKAKLVKEGKIRKEKPLPPVAPEEVPFEVPKGWEWEKIGNSVMATDYGLSEKTYDLSEGYPVIKMGDVAGGRVFLGNQKMVPLETDGLPYLLLKNGDLLYNRTNSEELVGKTGIFLGANEAYTYASYLIRIRPFQHLLVSKFLNYAMNAPFYRKTQVEPHIKRQCGQANINGTVMRNMVMPIPPLAEQHRIVAKVDELMALCDALEERLTAAKEAQEKYGQAAVGGGAITPGFKR